MMRKLIIARGPSTSGKTRAAYEWAGQSRGDRKVVHVANEFQLGGALVWLQNGFDVFIDPEGPKVVSPEPFKGWADIEIRKFPEGEDS